MTAAIKLKTGTKTDSPESPQSGFQGTHSTKCSRNSDTASHISPQPDYGCSCTQDCSLPTWWPPRTVLTIKWIDRGAKEWVGARVAGKQNVKIKPWQFFSMCSDIYMEDLLCLRPKTYKEVWKEFFFFHNTQQKSAESTFASDFSYSLSQMFSLGLSTCALIRPVSSLAVLPFL